MSSPAHPVPFPLNDPSRGFSRQPLRSGPFSGMDHPTPPSPNSRASSPVLYDQHLVSDLSAVSQASELAVTKRAEEDARHAQALSQYRRDKIPLVPPRPFSGVPTKPGVVRKQLMPRGVPITAEEQKSALNYHALYTTHYKTRIINECHARHSLTGSAHARHMRMSGGAPRVPTIHLGGEPVLSLHETERLINEMERSKEKWRWPKKSFGRTNRAVSAPQGVLIEDLSRSDVRITRGQARTPKRQSDPFKSAQAQAEWGPLNYRDVEASPGSVWSRGSSSRPSTGPLGRPVAPWDSRQALSPSPMMGMTMSGSLPAL